MRRDNQIIVFAAAIIIILIIGIEYSSEPKELDGQDIISPSTTINLGEKKVEITVIETSKGTIEIELDREKAPKSVENFVKYVESGFYDGVVFHRVISGFMVQGGGFTPDGKQKSTKPPIAIESQNGLKNLRGTIAMARTNNPNSATSQFFINVVDNKMLDYSTGSPGYAVFGKVIDGMDVVDQIRYAQTTVKYGMRDWPEKDITIVKAYMK